MSRTSRIAFLSLFMLALSSVATAGIYDGWALRMKITFAGYNPPGGGTLTNFPALIVFSNGMASDFHYGDFLSAAAGDLRFSDSNGTTALNYEIDTWNTNGVSSVWVQVPTISSTNDYIWAYWGVGGATPPPCTTNGSVWTNVYLGVWHLGTTNGVANLRDSTGNGFNGTSAGGSVTNAVGMIGGAQGFAGGANDYVSIPALNVTATNFSVFAWINGHPNGQYAGIVYSRPGGQGCGLGYNITGPPGQLSYTWNNAGNTWGWNDGLYPTNNAWAYVGVVITPAQAILYCASTNGGYLTAANNVGHASASLTTPFEIAADPGNGYRLVGQVDEARVSLLPLSPSWVWATWVNMASNGAFNSYGSVQGVPLVNNAGGATNITATSAVLNGTLLETGGCASAVFVFWGTTDGGTNWSWANTNSWAAPQSPGTYAYAVSSLTTNATIYYRFAATNANGVGWASSSSAFMTAPVWVQKTSEAIETGTVPGTFTVYRASTQTNAAITVYYTVGGTAIAGVHYANNLGGSVILPAGASSATVVVTPLVRPVADGNHTVVLTLTGGAELGSPSAATMFIVAPPPYYYGWKHKLPITFAGYTPPGGGTLTNFPALVVLSTNISGFRYRDFLQTNADLRFADSNQLTALNYEIDTWNTNGNSCVWVQVPTLSSTNDYIWAYWGMGGTNAPPCTTNGSVWTNVYLGVWHLGATNAVRDLRDSTGNGFNGTSGGGTVTNAVGVIGGAQGFAGGNNDYVSIPTFNVTATNCSIFAWISGYPNNNYSGIMFSRPAGGLGYNQQSPARLSYTWNGDKWQWTGAPNPANNVWSYVGVVITPAQGVVYDASAAGFVSVANVAGNAAAALTTPFWIAGDPQGGRLFVGQMDEVRVSLLPLSPSWIWTSWMNTASNGVFNGSFNTYGAVQSLSVGVAVFFR